MTDIRHEEKDFRFQFRYGSDANIDDTATKKGGRVGEPFYATDTQVLYVHNGTECFPASTNVPVRSVSTTYTALPTDGVILADATSAAFTVTLPAAANVTNQMYVVKKVDASNTVTVDADGSETIDGATTHSLSSQYDSVHVVSDGSNWHIIS